MVFTKTSSFHLMYITTSIFINKIKYLLQVRGLKAVGRVKAVSDSNSSMGTIFVLGTTQNLNFSKPPIVIIGFL